MITQYFHPRPKSPNTAISPHKRLNDGNNKVNDIVPGCLEVKDYITNKKLKTSSPQECLTAVNQRQSKPDRKSVMLGSLVRTKKRTCRVRSSTSDDAIQTTRSYSTLAQASTSKAKACNPFWNEHTAEMSKQLWYGTKSDFVDLDLNCSNSSSTRPVRSSWFTAKQVVEPQMSNNSRNWFTTCCPSSTLLSTEITEEDQQLKEESEENLLIENLEEETIEKIPSNRCIKIRIYPDKTQRATLLKWMGTARWTFNALKKAMDEHKVELTKKSLRHYAVKSDCELIKQDPTKKWIFETPYEVRDGAMLDFLQAYKTNFAKQKKNKNNYKFEVKYRSKKHYAQTINILNRTFKNGTFYPTFFGKIPVKSSQPLPVKLDYDSKLTRNYLGQYFLCMPKAPNTLEAKCTAKDQIVSVDPGVRTFATLYDPGGKLCKWGDRDIGLIQRLCSYADKLQSSIAKMRNVQGNGKKRRHKIWSHTKAMRRIFERIRNLVRDFHCKFAKWLCQNYQLILLPSFNSQAMSKRAGRKIGSKSARQMLTWSHFKFQQRLIHKASMFKDCIVKIVDESYTSKTCGKCGAIHSSLGGAKTFKCPSCEFVLDRDVNGARNILLRYITVNSI